MCLYIKRAHVCSCACLCVSMCICGSRGLGYRRAGWGRSKEKVVGIIGQEAGVRGEHHRDTSSEDDPMFRNKVSLDTYCAGNQCDISVLWPPGPLSSCRSEKEVLFIDLTLHSCIPHGHIRTQAPDFLFSPQLGLCPV